MTLLGELPVREWGLRIGGREEPGRGDRTLTRHMPGRPDRTVGSFRFATGAEVDRAIETVAAAQAGWSDQRPAERSEVLFRAAAQVRERREEFAAWECLESGMLMDLARQHAIWCAELLEFYAGHGRALSGRTFELGAGKLGLVLPQPVGVVAAIGPWNFPLSELIWKIAPALAAGCGVVIKPSELTPITSFLLDEVLHEAGIPEGLTAVVIGDREVGEALVGHPEVGLISLTGGVETGRAVIRGSAAHVTPTLMELGGKSAVVVLLSADATAAAEVVAPAVAFRTGQACTCPSRVVAVGGPGRAREVGEAIDEALTRLVPGPPDDSATSLGPAISVEHARRVRGMLDAAAAAGATLLRSVDDLGEEYLAPTVGLDADPGSPLLREEIFGPVTAVLPAGTVEEALALANDTPFGLAAGVVSGGDLGTALALARRLRAGSVWIDQWGVIEVELPFGGMGVSGFGRELGMAGIEAFVSWKSIHLPHQALDQGVRGEGGG